MNVKDRLFFAFILIILPSFIYIIFKFRGIKKTAAMEWHQHQHIVVYLLYYLKVKCNTHSSSQSIPYGQESAIENPAYCFFDVMKILISI